MSDIRATDQRFLLRCWGREAKTVRGETERRHTLSLQLLGVQMPASAAIEDSSGCSSHCRLLTTKYRMGFHTPLGLDP